MLVLMRVTDMSPPGRPLKVLRECGKGNNFVGSIILGLRDKTVKVVNLDLIKFAFKQPLLDYQFDHHIDSATSLTGSLLAVCLSTGLILILKIDSTLNPIDNSTLKPYDLPTTTQRSQALFTFNSGHYFFKINREPNFNLELYGGLGGALIGSI